MIVLSSAPEPAVSPEMTEASSTAVTVGVTVTAELERAPSDACNVKAGNGSPLFTRARPSAFSSTRFGMEPGTVKLSMPHDSSVTP